MAVLQDIKSIHRFHLLKSVKSVQFWCPRVTVRNPETLHRVTFPVSVCLLVTVGSISERLQRKLISHLCQHNIEEEEEEEEEFDFLKILLLLLLL